MSGDDPESRCHFQTPSRLTPRERGCPFGLEGRSETFTAFLSGFSSSCIPPWRLGGSGASEVAAVAPSDAVGGPVVDGGGCPSADLSAALSVGDDDVRRWEEILAGVGGESARAQADALGEASQT